MTKAECEKCEMLMDKAIELAARSKLEWEKYEELSKEGREIDAEIKQRASDQDYGEAMGIRLALEMLNFHHDRMKELENLL